MKKATAGKRQGGVPAQGAQRILAAAETLFARRGFAAVSMSAIAKKARVSKANIYHHFPTKDNLYLAVLTHASRGTSELLEEIQSSGEPLARRLRRFADSHLQSLLDHSDMARLVLADLLLDSSRHGRKIAESGLTEDFNKLTRIIRSGQESGELRKELDPVMVATMIYAADLFFFQHRDLMRHNKEVRFADSPRRFVAMLTEILVSGAKARGKKQRREGARWKRTQG